MINDHAIVVRYAEAFIGYARKSIGVERAIEDIRKVKDIIRDNAEFKEFIESTDITAYEKAALIESVLKNEISEEALNFLKLLLDKKRIGLFVDIAEYLRLTYAHEGEEGVVLRASSMLDLDLVKKMEAKLTAKFGRKFRFYMDLDDSLLGGVQVVIGNTILDGSVKRRIIELKEKLKGTEVY